LLSLAVETAWIRIPILARRISDGLTSTLLDGHYLAAWPAAAGLLPYSAILVGLAIGSLHLGFDVVFSEAMYLMATGAVLGTLSLQLGLLYVIGFAVGDLLLSNGALARAPSLFAAQVIEYALLALLCVTLPRTIRALLVQLALPDAIPRSARFALAVAGHLALTAGAVYLWAQIVPILIRPCFTWAGRSPTVAAIAPLQSDAAVLIVVSTVASLARMTLLGWTVFQPASRARIDALEAQLAVATPVRTLASRAPAWGIAAARTLGGLLLLAGMLEHWLDAVLLGVLMAALHLARARLIPVPLGRWPVWVEAVPLLFRILLGLVAVSYLSSLVLGWQPRGASFRPIVVLVGVSLVIFFLLAPGLPRATGRSDDTAARAGRDGSDVGGGA
jgi:hypothetical protein